jgi:ankyrin repeat protein
VGLDQQDEAGNSLLYVAASTGNLEVVQYLVENGVSLGFAEYQPLDYDPLKVAIINNNYDTAKYLLDSGASFNIDEALGYDGSIGDLYVGELFKANDSLQGAAQNGNMEMIHLIEDHGFPMNENTYYRALKAAAINGQLEVMEYFFRKGADPNYVDNRFADNASLLEICASNGNLEAVQLLKKYGATIETDDSDALANAVSAGNYDIAEYLIANRMNINSYSKTHNNPKLFSAWHAASEHGYFDLIKLLLKNGADVNDKYTAMLVCYAKGSTRITKYLIDNGADVNLQQSDGTAALHIAAQNHRTENVRMLLAAGADPGIKNDEGKTALDIAKEAGADEIEGLLNSK